MQNITALNRAQHLVRRCASVATGVALLVGCSSYSPPQGTAVATVSLKMNPGDLLVGYGTYCSSKQHIPKANWDNFQVKANEPVWIRILMPVNARQRCQGEVTFTPDTGAQYVASVSAGWQSCILLISKLSADGKLVPVLDAKSERERSCLTGG